MGFFLNRVNEVELSSGTLGKLLPDSYITVNAGATQTVATTTTTEQYLDCYVIAFISIEGSAESVDNAIVSLNIDGITKNTYSSSIGADSMYHFVVGYHQKRLEKGKTITVTVKNEDSTAACYVLAKIFILSTKSDAI